MGISFIKFKIFEFINYFKTNYIYMYIIINIILDKCLKVDGNLFSKLV